MPFQPVESRRLYRQVADQIEGLIRSGAFARGERLPPERDLSARLGVSRATVREAMIALELAGLVEVRGGSGIYVGGGSAAAATEEDAGPGPFELIDARRAIEPGVAALAAINATADETGAIAAAVAGMRQDHAQGIPGEANDRLFHLAVARATHNAYLARLVGELWEWRRGEMWSRLGSDLHAPAKEQRWIDDHERILGAVRRRDAELAQLAMREHLLRVKEEMWNAMEAENGGDNAPR